MSKKPSLAQFLNRANSPAGKLLIRAWFLLKAIHSPHTTALMKDIDDYLGNLLTNRPKADEPANN